VDKTIDSHIANVKIKGDENGKAYIEIDGKRVKGVTSYRIEHNASDKRTPVLELKVLCNLEMDTGAIPLLPEPWSWFYKPIKENLVDGHSFEGDGTNL